MLTELHLLRPYWLLALVPLGAVLWFSYRAQADDSGWQRVCDPRFLPYLLKIRQSTSHRRWLGLLGLGWLIAVLALAGPSWSTQSQPVYSAQHARVIVLDLSRSMLASDLKPTRLTRARFKIADILARSGEGQTGLVVFAGDAFVVSPLTQDAATVSALLSALDPSIMPVQGSRVDLGVDKAVALLRQAGFNHGEILLVTDGSDGSDDESAFAAVRRAQAQGFPVSLLAVGTPEGAPISLPEGGFLKDYAGNIVIPRLYPKQMQRLAAAGEGRYALYNVDNADLDWLLTDTVPGLADEFKSTDQQTTQWREQGPWLVLCLVPLAALAFRQGWLLLLLVLILPPPASALSWSDLWQRRDQQVADALEQGDFDQAARLAEDPLQRGVANYRRGRYAEAAQDFAQGSSPKAHYNRGNALAQLNRLEEALAAYDAALAQNPDLEDAKANRDLIEALLRQQQPPPASSDQDSAQDSQPQAPPDSQGGESQQEGQQSAPAQTAKAREEDGPEGKASNSLPENQSAGDEKADTEETNPTQAQVERQESSAGEQADTEEGVTNAGEQRQDTLQQQAIEQWLRRIPDDPGGLLRRKFLYQYERRDRQTTTATGATGEDW